MGWCMCSGFESLSEHTQAEFQEMSVLFLHIFQWDVLLLGLYTCLLDLRRLVNFARMIDKAAEEKWVVYAYVF